MPEAMGGRTGRGGRSLPAWAALAMLALQPAASEAARGVQAPDGSVAMASIPGLMRVGLVPGLQVAVIGNGGVRVRAFGTADVRTGAPVTADTVFEAASLGKPVFAYGVLRLASEGRIDVDAPIGRYLDGLDGATAAVTARRLLSHSAGLPNTPPVDGRLIAAPATPARFSYSGEGIRLLQRAVERITGQDLQTYMQAAVFAPLGMTRSSYVWRDDYARLKAFGHGYTGSSAGRSRMTRAQAVSSLETTAEDYARFLLAVVRGTGLRPDLARAMTAPQVALETGCVICLGRPRGAAAAGMSWGLGIGLARAGGRTYAWHWGDNGTMQSYAAVEADGRRGVVILANSANGHAIAQTIASSLLGTDAPGYAWVASYGAYTEPVRRLTSAIVRRGVDRLTPAELDVPRADLRLAAERLTEGGHAAEAAALLRRAVARGGEAEDRAMLAEALRRQGAADEAEAAARGALAVDPGNKRAMQVLERVGQARRVIPAATLARYAGRYDSPFGLLTVSTDGRRLKATLPDQPDSDMLPLSDNRFLMEGVGVPIEFVAGPDGTVTHAVVQAGGEIRLARIG